MFIPIISHTNHINNFPYGLLIYGITDVCGGVGDGEWG